MDNLPEVFECRMHTSAYFVKIVQQHLCEVDIQVTSSGRIGVLALLRSVLRGRGCVRTLRGVGEAGVG